MTIDLSAKNWTLKVSNYSKPASALVSREKFSPLFFSRLIRVSITSKSTRTIAVKASWRRGGYLYQIQKGSESFSYVVPVNQSTLIVLPRLQTSYQIAFRAVPWLPNLKLKIWEYKVRDPEGLGVLGVEPYVNQIAQINAATAGQSDPNYQNGNSGDDGDYGNSSDSNYQ